MATPITHEYLLAGLPVPHPLFPAAVVRPLRNRGRNRHSTSAMVIRSVSYSSDELHLLQEGLL
jgi:hypothetical protein